jgi:hypothetical protein
VRLSATIGRVGQGRLVFVQRFVQRKPYLENCRPRLRHLAGNSATFMSGCTTLSMTIRVPERRLKV